MIGKLGLVGGVACAWLLTFVLMGGDVMPAIMSADTGATGETAAAIVPKKAPATLPSATPTTDATPTDDRADSADRTRGDTGPAGQAAPAALSAEAIAEAEAIAGETLVNRPAPRRSAPPVATFRISSFNILGSSHTRGRSPRAPGTARAARASSYVLENNIDLIGFQEMQTDQRRTFTQATGGRYGLYPGDQLRGLDGENSIAYRLDTWELVKADTVPIPYFGGRIRNMPVLLLKHKKSGITSYVANFHNPANTKQYGNQDRHKAAAKARQVALFADLRDDGYPLLVTGDMNERQSWFCAVAGPGDLRAAAGGEGGREGCSVAGGFRIDWIAGSHDVEFSNYREDRSGTVKWITDHPVIVSDVKIDAQWFPASVLN